MCRILVIDDDEKILKLIRNILMLDGYDVDVYTNFNDVPESRLVRYELILLDVMMPGIDGFEVCNQIRDKVDCPIIFITAKSREEDMVYGLGLGADDYIQKPFGMEGLRAKVNAHIRREKREHRAVLRSGIVEFDLQGKKISINNCVISLTKGEYEICEYLARHKGQVFSREQIYEAVFGYDGESNDSTIATHIKNIRMKLDLKGVSPIQTVWGIGYKWEV